MEPLYLAEWQDRSGVTVMAFVNDAGAELIGVNVIAGHWHLVTLTRLT